MNNRLKDRFNHSAKKHSDIRLNDKIPEKICTNRQNEIASTRFPVVKYDIWSARGTNMCEKYLPNMYSLGSGDFPSFKYSNARHLPWTITKIAISYQKLHIYTKTSVHFNMPALLKT